MLYQYNNIYISLHKYLKGKTHTHTHTHTQNRLLEKKNVAIVATVPLGTVVIVQNLGGKKSGSRNRKTFILNYGWSQFHILLFYFDL